MGMHRLSDHAESLGPGSALVKISVLLAPSAGHSYASETLWAEHVVEDHFRIMNVPFLAKELSFGDVVRGRLGSGGIELAELATRGGHSTYRFVLSPGTTDDRWRPFWVQLEALGCTFERATDRLFAVDVPPATDIHQAFQILDAGEVAGVWTFEEGHCGHVV
jgi:hypothetical protein